MSDRHTLNAVLTTVKRWEQDSKYTDAEAMVDVARIMDQHASTGNREIRRQKGA